MSPHLLRYNERVRIAGVDATDELLVAGFEAVEAARGRDRHQPQAVGLRAGGEFGVLDHLQAEIPRRQAAQRQQHQQEADQRAAAE